MQGIIFDFSYQMIWQSLVFVFDRSRLNPSRTLHRNMVVVWIGINFAQDFVHESEQQFFLVRMLLRIEHQGNLAIKNATNNKDARSKNGDNYNMPNLDQFFL